MKIVVLLGQRKETYRGQYAPEVLASMNTVHYEEDSSFLDNMAEENKPFMSNIALVELYVDSNDIDHILNPIAPIITTVVTKTESI